jgi:hypothetical protein
MALDKTLQLLLEIEDKDLTASIIVYPVTLAVIR